MRHPQKKHTTHHERSLQARTSRSYQPDKPTRTEDSHLPPQPLEPPKKRFFTRKKIVLLVILLVVTPFLVIGIWDLKNFSGASQKLFGTKYGFGLLRPATLDSTPQGRVNIMLIGYSVDDPGHGGALLTDSILVISLDKEDHTGYILSIPRDLYVDIPDYGSAKINEAFPAGKSNHFRAPGYPNDGPGMLQKVIADTFKIDVHYYALVNYTAVKDIVNALEGVKVTIRSPDPRGIYDPAFPPNQGGPLKLSNGSHKVNGQTALRLTRARGSTFGSYGFPLSDFNRTQNQQAVFKAIKTKLNRKLILDPRKNSKLFDAVGENVKTDITQPEVIPLYRLFNSVPNDKLKAVTLRSVDGVNLLTSYTTPTGQSALIPAAGLGNYSQIQRALANLNR